MAYPLPDKPSIAVLPFGNLSDDAGQDFFAAGITDDIITDLSKISGLFVTAPHATQSFKGKDASIREISEALGVRYVLSGSVRRDGERVRITAQLADALRGDHIWSNRYDRELVNVFSVQSEVTKRVVAAMEVTLKAREQDRVYQKYVTNIDAYDAWQRARAMVEVPSKKNILEAEGLFQKTIELDPSFAGGYAGLSFNHSVKARFGYGGSREADVDQAYKLAEKALATDPSFAWSHIAMAGAHLARLEHDAAVDSARNALAIQPGGYETNLFMAFYLAFGDKPALAVQYAEAADNLSRTPTYRGLIFLGIAYLTAQEYARSEAALLNAKSLVGRAHDGLFVFLIAAQLGQGKASEAAETAAELKRLYPNFRVSGWGNLKSLKSEAIRHELVRSALSVGIPE
jgi:TolB-like protein